MPIRPENRGLYPKEWKAMVAAARVRSGNRCECTGQCGFAHEGGRCERRNGDMISTETGSVVVLTLAHEHGVPLEETSIERMFHACQRCHNRYDGPMRRAGTQARERAKAAVGDLFSRLAEPFLQRRLGGFYQHCRVALQLTLEIRTHDSLTALQDCIALLAQVLKLRRRQNGRLPFPGRHVGLHGFQPGRLHASAALDVVELVRIDAGGAQLGHAGACAADKIAAVETPVFHSAECGSKFRDCKGASC